MFQWVDLIPDFFFRGTKFRCNICGFSANHFLPRGHHYPIIKELDIIGAGKRYVDCKKCGSSDRDRLVFEFLKSKNQYKSLTGATFLHVAPERALSQKIVDEFQCSAVKIDFKAPGYRFIYAADVITQDIQSLSFDSNTFDFVICNHVLEHVKNDSQALSEIYRVLKPGGFAVLQVPISLKINGTISAEKNWKDREKKLFLGQKDHLRLYGPDFFKIIENHNLIIEFWSIDSENMKNKLKLNPKEFIITATKSIH